MTLFELKRSVFLLGDVLRKNAPFLTAQIYELPKADKSISQRAIAEVHAIVVAPAH